MKLPKELHWLYRQVRPFLGLHWLRITCLVSTGVLQLLDPLVLKWLIDDVLAWRRWSMLPVAAAAFFLVYLFRFTLFGLGALVNYYAGQRTAFNIRVKLLRHLQRLSAKHFDNRSVGDTLHRIQQDVDQIEQLAGELVGSIIWFVVVTSLTLVVMFYLSWQLTLLSLPLIPVLLLIRRYGYPRLKSASDEVQRASGRTSGFLHEHLSGLVQIHLLGAELRELRRFTSVVRELIRLQVSRRSVELIVGLLSMMVSVTAIALALGLGGYQVLRGTLTVGGLVAFYTYLNRIFDPIRDMVDMYSRLQRANASIRRVMGLLEETPEVVERPGARRLPATTRGRVVVRDLHFGYKEEREVLAGVSLALEPGEKVALVGSSGSGKTTLAKLLVRLYDPASGEVSIDGERLVDLELHSLRAAVALVPQDPVLFDVTLRENLLYGHPKASEEEIRRALELAQLTDMVAGLESGLDEPLGPRGGKLSGGQRQRLALARAILAEPRVLILDEATSALDGPTERALLEALDGFVADRTTLLIAHRISAVRWADRIVVMADGQVVEVGSHDDLYAAGGTYRRLCDEQLKNPVTEEEPAGVAGRRSA
ncbi:MAG: ABC transporter ATP-binding protein [Acidobacteria bacterium]|nr:ABC transporter ATP-binding protein [Acidobacteriota bacterium]